MIGWGDRDEGDMRIDNELNGGYEGEIQVIKGGMGGDWEMNCIGDVCDKD
ncbi:phospho-sugar glycosidase domain-containing protein, partial [Staphylococcus epidermidis]